MWNVKRFRFLILAQSIAFGLLWSTEGNSYGLWSHFIGLKLFPGSGIAWGIGAGFILLTLYLGLTFGSKLFRTLNTVAWGVATLFLIVVSFLFRDVVLVSTDLVAASSLLFGLGVVSVAISYSNDLADHFVG